MEEGELSASMNSLEGAKVKETVADVRDRELSTAM